MWLEDGSIGSSWRPIRLVSGLAGEAFTLLLHIFFPLDALAGIQWGPEEGSKCLFLCRTIISNMCVALVHRLLVHTMGLGLLGTPMAGPRKAKYPVPLELAALVCS